VKKGKGVIVRLGNRQLAPAGRRVPEYDAMEKDSKPGLRGEELGFGPYTIEAVMQARDP